MSELSAIELYEKLEEYIRKIIDCEVWGLDLITYYALVTSTIKQIRNKHPFYPEREAEYKKLRAQRKSEYIKAKMEEATS